MILRCSNCGHNQKSTDIENLLYTIRCYICGRILKEGKRDIINLYHEYLKSEHWQTTKSPLQQENRIPSNLIVSCYECGWKNVVSKCIIEEETIDEYGTSIEVPVCPCCGGDIDI